MDVRVGEQAQSLQPFLVGYGLRKSGNRGGIEDVAALHGSGHVQMVFNERLNFPSFLGRKFQALGRAIERREAPGDVILDRHAFADIVQQQRENRSEERRVGKECRSRWWPYHEKKKKEVKQRR